MSQARLNIPKTREIKSPTYYVEALCGEFSQYAFDEERSELFKGRWRAEAFQAPVDIALDLEIGTGTGIFFAHRAMAERERLLLGIELKFKPLIQTIRRTLKQGCKNARVLRYNASFVEKLFQADEVDNVFIHHPDPWTQRRKHKHRLMSSEFLAKLFILQKADSFLDFKTDSQDYFLWACEQIAQTRYVIDRHSEDLHQSLWSDENVITQFERIFLSKGQPIYYFRAVKPAAI